MSAPKLAVTIGVVGSNDQKQQGTMLAISRAQVLAYLDDQGIDVSFVFKAQAPVPSNTREGPRKGTLLTRQWAGMIDAEYQSQLHSNLLQTIFPRRN